MEVVNRSPFGNASAILPATERWRASILPVYKQGWWASTSGSCADGLFSRSRDGRAPSSETSNRPNFTRPEVVRPLRGVGGDFGKINNVLQGSNGRLIQFSMRLEF